jgi:hypothetical protein
MNIPLIVDLGSCFYVFSLSIIMKMHLLFPLVVAILAPAGLAAPARDIPTHNEALWKRENLCSLKSPPALCQPSDNVTVEETAKRAYKFYRAFVVDGDPRTMFSLIDSSYIVSNHYRDLTQRMTSLPEAGSRLHTDPTIATPSGVRKWPPNHLDPILQWE